jgi:hypothetical protein
MTSETHLVFDISDILFVRLKCVKCKAVFSVEPEHWERITYICGNCGTQWLLNMSEDEATLNRLKKSIEALRTGNDRFLVQLEMANPHA